jgi:hypothetical protein
MRLLTVVLAAAFLPFATFAQTQVLPNGTGGYNLYGAMPASRQRPPKPPPHVGACETRTFNPRIPECMH